MITALIISLIGLIFILIGLSQLMQFQKLSRIGKKTVGVVFDTAIEGGSQGSGISYPIIRFTTEKEEWITERYTIGGITGLISKGKHVNVIYNPEKPTEFVVESGVVKFVLRALLIIGVALVAVGVVGYLVYPDFFNRSGQP